MSLNKLSISYRCHNAIGNSLDLKEMMKEVIKTFVLETEAVHGSYCFFENDCCEKLVTIGKKIEYDIKNLKNSLDFDGFCIDSYSEKVKLLKYKLDNSCMLFAYETDSDIDFIVTIFESFKNKLNISINSCLNMKELKKKNQELEELTCTLQDEVQNATRENLEKEKKIFDQIKMSQMGELIGNIAHQWRQPLSVISTAASGMKLKKELQILTDEDQFHYLQSIIDNSLYLSNTIDEFRDYIDDSHKQKEVIIQDRLKMAIKLVESTFSIQNIKIIEGHIEKEAIHFKLILGELLQVLISILNNAKEALLINEIENKWVKYELHKTDYSICITIEDSAGGIPEEILDKIFNPYFTTKHQYQGTGIGLYSGYDIIVNRLNGKFFVKNTENGAKFFIELPLNINYTI